MPGDREPGDVGHLVVCFGAGSGPYCSVPSPPLWMLRTAFRTVGSVAPGVAARWAETIFCRPPRHPPRPAEEAFLATGSRVNVSSEGQDIAAWVWGEGPVVVLTHGWGGRAGRFSAMAGALLSQGFRVVLFDAPAHGHSEGTQASLPQFSRALSDVATSFDSVHAVVGHSLGGAAVSLALHWGLQPNRVVLLAPPADVYLFSHAFAEHLRIPLRARSLMQENLERRLDISWDQLHIPTLARGMSAPALIVHDRMDPDVPYQHGVEIANAWPGAELLTTEGLGHRAILRHPEVVRRTVEFVQDGIQP
jgi:pimeloyl-ACP methyl ester carboxylesterase